MCNFNPVFEWILGIFRANVLSLLLKIGSDGTESIKHRNFK